MSHRDKGNRGRGTGGRGNRDKRKFNTKKELWADNRLNRQVQGPDGTMIEERHKGSYNLDELKRSDIYKSQIGYIKALYPNLDTVAANEAPTFVSSDLLLPRSKRKMAVCFGYLGTNYQGLQVNPDAETVEKELERAFFLTGAIQESNFGHLQKVQWTRAARTDRGVHAAAQCCAMKLNLPLNQRDKFITQVNTFLPADIRIHCMTKVSKGFNAKMFCSKRRYQYLLPTYVLHDIQTMHTILNEAYKKQGPIVGAGYEGGFVEEGSTKSLHADSLREVRTSLTSFRLPPHSLAALRSALKRYEGTHPFHNFTTGKTSDEANATRYILSFTCSDPFLIPSDLIHSSSSSNNSNSGDSNSSESNSGDSSSGGVEWVLLSVVGQSFLLNQIRKMVSLAVEVVRRGLKAEVAIDSAFHSQKIDITMAPGLGLYLDELFFDGFNNKQRRHTSKMNLTVIKKATTTTTTSNSSNIADVEIVESSSSSGVKESETAEGEEEESVKKKQRLNEDNEDTVLKGNGSIEGVEKVDVIGQVEEKEDEGDNAIDVEVGDEEAAENDDGDAQGVFEEIKWHEDGGMKAIIDKFVKEVIHPHIFQEEVTSLQFLYYLDSLRAYPSRFLKN